jgi:hypothetical protein
MKHASAFEMKKRQRLDDEKARLFKEKEDAANLKREAKNARRRAQDAASKKQKAAAAKAAAEKAAEKAAAEKASAEKAAAEKAAAEKAAKEALALKSAKTANAKTAAVAAFSEARCKQLEKDVAVAKRKLVEEIALRTQIEKEKDGYRSQLTIAAQAANVTVTETRAGSFKVAAVVPSPGKANSRLVRQQGKHVQILMMLFIIIIHKFKKQSFHVDSRNEAVAVAEVPSSARDDLRIVAFTATEGSPGATSRLALGPGNSAPILAASGLAADGLPAAIDATTARAAGPGNSAPILAASGLAADGLPAAIVATTARAAGPDNSAVTAVAAITAGGPPVAMDATILSAEVVARHVQDSLAEFKGMIGPAVLEAVKQILPKLQEGTPLIAPSIEPQRTSAIVSVHGRSQPREDGRFDRDFPRPGSYHESVRGTYYDSPRDREFYDSRRDSCRDDARRSDAQRYSNQIRGGMSSYDSWHDVHDGFRSSGHFYRGR